MDWSRANPYREIHGAIDRLRHDRTAWQHQLDDAVTAEIRALALVDSARAAQTDARTHVRFDTAEIDRLLEELPTPRPAED